MHTEFCFSFHVAFTLSTMKSRINILNWSWVGATTQGRHQKVSQEVFAEVERYAKSALEDDSDSGNDDM